MSTKQLVSRKKFMMSLGIFAGLAIILLPLYVAAILKLLLWLFEF